jgi:hypothetical protein
MFNRIVQQLERSVTNHRLFDTYGTAAFTTDKLTCVCRRSV